MPCLSYRCHGFPRPGAKEFLGHGNELSPGGANPGRREYALPRRGPAWGGWDFDADSFRLKVVAWVLVRTRTLPLKSSTIEGPE